MPSYGEQGCRCKDLLFNASTGPTSEGGRPDGIGSYLANGPEGPGQFCYDHGGSSENEPMVCGKVQHAGNDYPICQVCGVDTNMSCPCDRDVECEGIEDNLVCWGSEDHGWGPSGTPGTCLPSPDFDSGRAALKDLPWFCLDNCGSIASGDPACVYDQTYPEFSHGTCVDWSASCWVDDCPFGQGCCEATGRRCLDDDVCRPECFDDEGNCGALGFPSHYVCNNGYCVPLGCGGSGIPDQEWCSLFR